MALASVADTQVRVGPQGRIVIPAGLRRELGLDEGTVLSARVADGRLVLERRADVLARIRRSFASVPVALSDELIADRRAEASDESR